MRVLYSCICIALLWASGCRHVRPVDPVDATYEPLLDRAAVRSGLADSRSAGESGDALRERITELTADLYAALSELHRSGPLPREEGRAREAEILREYLTAVRRELKKADTGATPAVENVTVTIEELFGSAERAAAAGRYEVAIAEAEALLERLPDDGAYASLVAHLRYSVGLWHLAKGQYADARSAFGSLQPSQELAAELADQCHLMAEQIDLLLTLPPGPQRDRLALGWALLEMGDEDGARAAAEEIVATAEHPDIQREVAYLLSEVDLIQARRFDVLRREASSDIADGAPFDRARECVAVLRSSGGHTAAAEIERAIGVAEAELASAATVELDEVWSSTLAQARELVTQEQFREAARLFDRFAGTEMEQRAREEAGRALDILVREERKRAGDQFVAAQQQDDPQRRRQLLESAAGILRSLLEEFPDSSYSDRVRRNLAAVEEALSSVENGEEQEEPAEGEEPR